MKAVNKILVAVDFSDYSLPAVKYGVQLAQDVGAALLLVNVYNQRDVDILKKIEGGYADFSFQKYFDENMQDRNRLLEGLAEDSGCRRLGINAELVVRHGVPHEELLEEIKIKKPDLLVMAVKGRSNLVDTIIGSCAHKMFRLSPIPVLSIRSED